MQPCDFEFTICVCLIVISTLIFLLYYNYLKSKSFNSRLKKTIYGYVNFGSVAIEIDEKDYDRMRMEKAEEIYRELRI